MFRVTGLFCVAGNPTQAWAGTTGEDDEEHVPNDVWEEQSHDFGDDVGAARDFIGSLSSQMTTHIALQHSEDGDEWETICYMDSDADHLMDAVPGVVPPSQRDPEPLPGEHVVDDTLTPYESQEV